MKLSKHPNTLLKIVTETIETEQQSHLDNPIFWYNPNMKSPEELLLDLENLTLLHGHNHDSVARCYNDLGKAYFRQDAYAKALEYYGMAADLTKALNLEGADEYLIDIHYRYICSSIPFPFSL